MNRKLKINENAGEINLRVLSLGVGVQSSTLAFLSDLHVIGKYDLAVFVDLGYERDSTYEYFDYLCRRIDSFPIVRIKPKSDLMSDALEVVESKKGNLYSRKLLPIFTHNKTGKVGRVQTRGCTGEFKVATLMRYIKTISGVKYGQSWPSVEQSIGISTDEAHRMKDSRVAWSVHRYPLIEMGWSRDKCLTWLQANGLKTPNRSSCYFCPFQSQQSWNSLRTSEPHNFESAVTFEQRLNVTHQRTGFRNQVSLTKITRNLEDLPLENSEAKSFNRDLFGEECTGMCGV